MDKTNLLVIDGGSIKTSEEGVVSGKAIVFGSPKEPDRSNFKDFFTKSSFIRNETSFVVPLFYDHGIGPIKSQVGEATISYTDEGWDASAKLDLSTEDGKKVYEHVKENPHGFSTGAMSHLVSREPKENATNFLKRWVVGELSLTERPAERKAIVQSVKSVDGELVYEEAFDEKKDAVVISLLDAEDNELWNSTTDTKSLENLEGVKKFEIKDSVSGNVVYNMSMYDEKTGMSTDVSVYEYGGVGNLISHLQNVLNTAARAVKNKTDEELTLEEKVTSIVKNLIPEQSENEEVSTLKARLQEMETQLADVGTKLSESEDALTKANEDIARLEILAGAKETINKYKGK